MIELLLVAGLVAVVGLAARVAAGAQRRAIEAMSDDADLPPPDHGVTP